MLCFSLGGLNHVGGADRVVRPYEGVSFPFAVHPALAFFVTALRAIRESPLR